MKTIRLWTLILLFATGAYAQSGIPVRISPVSGTPQSVRVNEVLPERFVIQVVRTDTGAPMPGVELILEINYIMCLPMQPNCGAPPQSVYGRFESGPSIRLVSDAQGLVTAPPFIAGATAGRYEVHALVSSSQPPGINIDPAPLHFATFEIEQLQLGSGAPAAVPSLSTWAILLLAGLSVLVAFVQLRKTRKS